MKLQDCIRYDLHSRLFAVMWRLRFETTQAAEEDHAYHVCCFWMWWPYMIKSGMNSTPNYLKQGDSWGWKQGEASGTVETVPSSLDGRANAATLASRISESSNSFATKTAAATSPWMHKMSVMDLNAENQYSQLSSQQSLLITNLMIFRNHLNSRRPDVTAVVWTNWRQQEKQRQWQQEMFVKETLQFFSHHMQQASSRCSFTSCSHSESQQLFAAAPAAALKTHKIGICIHLHRHPVLNK